MGKRLFWIFVIMVVATTTIAVTYFQSESFARLAKAKMQAFVAKDLGLDLNFDYLRIGVLPPSLSMVNVELKVLNTNNPLGLATDTLFKAERLGFSFRMIQAFSRGIAVNKIFLSDGVVRLLVPKSKKNGGEKLSDLVHRPIRIEAGDGFTIDIRQLEIRDTVVDISWRDSSGLNQVQAGRIGYLAITPSAGGTSIVANIDDLSYRSPKLSEKLKVVKTNIEMSRNAVEIVSADLQRRDAVLHATGSLAGSIDAPEQMRSSLKVIVRTPLSEVADFEKSLKELGGSLNANFSVEGKLTDPKVAGSVELEGLKYRLWEIDRIQGEGAFSGGRLSVNSLVAIKGGGSISLKEKFEATLPFRDEAVEIQLQLKKFRFEDFAGDLRHSVNNLKAEIEGSARLKANFGSSGEKTKFSSAAAALDLRFSELELNNQVFGKKRPYKRIFQLQPFGAQGDLQFRNDELRVSTLKLSFGSGALVVKGAVSGARGFDLTAQGDAIDFGKEIREIGGIPVEGAGGLKAHVRGPLDKVLIDLDLKLKNARYVRFDLGDVDGRVTYDDSRDRILLTGLKGKKNSADYEADGEISVGDKETIAIEASFGESDPNHIFAIFKEQLKDISWIPHGMSGQVAGKVKVGGLYADALYTLRIDADLKAKNLGYQGEMVHSASISANLNDGVLRAAVKEAKKYDTPFRGEIEYRLRTDEMKYWLEAQKGKLRSLDFLTTTGFPIDGLFDFRSDGAGKWETLESKTTIAVRNAFVRTRAMPPLSITLSTDATHSDFSASLGGLLEANGRVANASRGDSSATIKAAGANLDFLLCGVSRKNCSDPNVGFLLRGETKLSWKGRDWQALSGSGLLQDLQLSRTGFLLRNEAPVPISATSGTIETPTFQLKGEQTRLAVKLKGRVDGKSLDNRIDGSASLRMLEFLTPVIEEARGQMAIGASLGGSIDNASFRGQVLLQDGFLRITGLDAPVESLNGRIRLDESKISLDDINAQLGGGTVQASGGVDLFLNRAPRFAIDLFLANNRLKFFPVNFVEVSDGKLSFTGDKPPYLFGGLVRMRRVVMRNDFDMGGGQKSTQHVRYLPESARGSSSFYEVRVRAIADGGVTVQNNLLDAEFRGEVTLLNNFEFPQIVARAELVRGKLLFRNTTFTLDHASIRAPTPELFNPQFSIGGTANVDIYRINIFASGTVDKPKITLNSYPAMPQEDIVSLLAFGYRGEEARRVDPNNTSAITYSEVTSILLDQLKLSQNLQSKGLRVMVMPDLSETEEQIARPDAATQAAPKVYLQTQILKNLDASFGTTVGASQTRRMDARLDYRIGRKATMSAVYEQIPSGLDAVRSEEAYRNSYGADLKFRWGFR